MADISPNFRRDSVWALGKRLVDRQAGFGKDDLRPPVDGRTVLGGNVNYGKATGGWGAALEGQAGHRGMERRLGHCWALRDGLEAHDRAADSHPWRIWSYSNQ